MCTKTKWRKTHYQTHPQTLSHTLAHKPSRKHPKRDSKCCSGPGLRACGEDGAAHKHKGLMSSPLHTQSLPLSHIHTHTHTHTQTQTHSISSPYTHTQIHLPSRYMRLCFATRLSR